MDITFGQYYPGKSLLHRMDARFKILVIVAYVVILFIIRNILGFLLPAFFLCLEVAISKVPVKTVVRSVKAILPLILFTAILNMFFVEGTPIFEFWILKPTREGLYNAVVMIIRITLLIVSTSMLTFTTTPIALTDAIERLLSPLKVIRFPAHEIAMMMTIALRFIPTLMEETNKIIAAQKARGADFESGNLIASAKAMIPLLIPLFVSAFRRAEELAVAMECRCYNGGDKRTKLRQPKITKIDWFALGAVALLIAGVIVLNIFLPF